MAEDLTGKQLGPFQIDSRLGQGAMGAVYRARHTENGRNVAIKVMTPASEDAAGKLAARFEREIKLLGKFRHPNIVRFYGASEDRGIRYYAMELVEGTTLESMISGKRALPLARTIAYATQICEALQEMHATGVVHRDLKPANILITADGKVKLTDFGIAKDTSAFSEEKLTAADHTVGTVAYMSPEQLAGQELTRKSDLYSLGILLYRMLTGTLPFAGETMFEYVQQRQAGVYPAPTTVNGSLPLEIDGILADLLAQNPEDRPRDAYVVMQRLMDLAKGRKEATKTRPKSPPKTVAETVEMRRGGLSTLLSTVFGTRESKKAKRKSGKTEAPEAKESFLESPVVLVTALLLVLGFTVYMFLPLSEEQLFARGKVEFEREALTAKQMETIFEEHFAPLLQKDPNGPHAKEIAEFRDRIALKRARERVKVASLGDYVPAKDATEAERQYLSAVRLRETMGDPINAEDRFRAIRRVFSDDPSSKAWVTLADEALANAKSFENDTERVEAKRRAVRAALLRASELRQSGDLDAALREYGAIETLYGADPEVSDLVWKASTDFLSPIDLFARGRERMQREDPAEWKKAFELYFDPLERMYPNHNEREAVEGFRKQLAMREARERVREHLKIGLPSDANEAEVQFTLAMYLKEQLNDPYTAYDTMGRLIGRYEEDENAANWVDLAKEELSQKPEAADRETWTNKKQEHARAAIRTLLANIDADADLEMWLQPVQEIYRLDPDTRAYADDLEKQP